MAAKGKLNSPGGKGDRRENTEMVLFRGSTFGKNEAACSAEISAVYREGARVAHGYESPGR